MLWTNIARTRNCGVWIALPGTVRAQILQWDARVTTKGELQKLAEGFAHQL
ncbi:MAG: hypothetical protein ACLR7U_01140 [Ruthenibacterium lactatiformans]